MWEVIGWIGSAVVVVSMMQQRLARLRVINLVGCLISLVYAVAIGAWPLAGLNAVLAVIQVVSLVRLLGTRHDARVYDVVAARPTDAVVAHVVARHGAEIAQFFPAFSRAEDSTDAFLVMTGDAVVGLVLATREGEAARLDVDYVTPPYRDLTPGEFVFRRSDVWRELGVHRIVTAGGGPEHYGRLGFTRVGERYELAL